VPLVREITDLQVQASLFAPMMYKIAVSTQKKMSLYATIGETKWIDLPGINLTGDATLKVKSNNNEFIPEIRKAGNLTAVNLSDYTNVSGIYTYCNRELQKVIPIKPWHLIIIVASPI
jgi:hypothetical protein